MSEQRPTESLVIEALEQERRAIAEELHDRVCQGLASSSILVEMLTRAAEAGKAFPLERIQALKRSLETVTDEIRSLARRLNPPSLEGSGLMSALAALAEGDARARCEFQCERPVFVSNGRSALALYRMAQTSWQEALPEAAWHLKMKLYEQGDKACLAISGPQPWLSRRCEEFVAWQARLIGGTSRAEVSGNEVVLICSVPRESTTGAKAASKGESVGRETAEGERAVGG